MIGYSLRVIRISMRVMMVLRNLQRFLKLFFKFICVQLFQNTFNLMSLSYKYTLKIAILPSFMYFFDLKLQPRISLPSFLNNPIIYSLYISKQYRITVIIIITLLIAGLVNDTLPFQSTDACMCYVILHICFTWAFDVIRTFRIHCQLHVNMPRRCCV